MLGWTKSQELWGKGRRLGRKRQWCEAQLLGKSKVTNGFWGSELRLGLGRKRVRRAGLVWKEEVKQPRWAAGAICPLPQPLTQCWTWLWVQNNWEREPAAPRQCGLTGFLACQSKLGKWGMSRCSCPSAHQLSFANLLHVVNVKMSNCSHSGPIHYLSSIFFSFPTARAQCIARHGSERLF